MNLDYKDNWNELKISILEWQNQLKKLENQRLKNREGRKLINIYYAMDKTLNKVLEKMEKIEE
ncbi:MAG: hypothetical protein ACLTG7_04190 [Romboutsia sp.]